MESMLLVLFGQPQLWVTTLQNMADKLKILTYFSTI